MMWEVWVYPIVGDSFLLTDDGLSDTSLVDLLMAAWRDPKYDVLEVGGAYMIVFASTGRRIMLVKEKETL